jgi:hypothetical protein
MTATFSLLQPLAHTCLNFFSHLAIYNSTPPPSPFPFPTPLLHLHHRITMPPLTEADCIRLLQIRQEGTKKNPSHAAGKQFAGRFLSDYFTTWRTNVNTRCGRHSRTYPNQSPSPKQPCTLKLINAQTLPATLISQNSLARWICPLRRI